MTDKTTETETSADEGFVKADPTKNPRNQSLAEIAKSVAERHKAEAAETSPTIDDEGVISQPTARPGATASQPPTEETSAEEPPVEPTAEEPPPASPEASPPAEAVTSSAAAAKPAGSIDANAEYEVEIDGQKVKVPGQKIIDAGYRTFQKETAADYRLNMASQLLREAEQRLAAAQPAAQPPQAQPAARTDAELAQDLQFGTPEKAAAAVALLKARGGEVSPQQIQQFVMQQTRAAVQDETAFQEGMKYVQSEFKDIFANDYLKRLFFVEENRRRAPKDRGGEGDTRPYRELYESIGADLRKNFNLTKPGTPPPDQPTTTAAERRTVKASTPPIPRTAASRLEAADAKAKAKTPSEIIAAMAESRGKSTLVPRLARKE
jgi:hypothetical protein